MLLDASDFIRRSLSVLSCLIDHGCRQQLRWIEVANGESLEPSFFPARDAVELRASDVPKLDVHAIGAALAEQEHRHGPKSIDMANKRQKRNERYVFTGCRAGAVNRNASARSTKRIDCRCASRPATRRRGAFIERAVNSPYSQA
jgi:hypothetical protein